MVYFEFQAANGIMPASKKFPRIPLDDNPPPATRCNLARQREWNDLIPFAK
jgi:hypothetical protein